MDGKTILPRSEVPEEFTWDLSHVFASDDKWNEELEALKAYSERMAAYAGKRALAICSISDNLVTGKELSADERQTTFTNMMKIALEVAVKMENKE